MRYVVLIYGSEAAMAAMSEQEQQTQFMGHLAFAQELREKGVMLAGEALQPTATATSVMVRGGKRTVTHGPFAETAEQLGGYYVLECANLDEALEWAAKNPSAATGTIEVRPLMDIM